MDLDTKRQARTMGIGKKRVDKRRQKKAGIVFQKYSDRLKKKSASGKASQSSKNNPRI